MSLSTPPADLPGGPRYRAVVEKRFNKRFTANPDYVRLAGSTEAVIAAVADAVREGRRLVVTSGGHCLEGFVADPDVRVIIDVSPMKRVYYDDAMRAIAVEAGATVGETFRALADNWGVVLPLGEYPGVGIGGHVCGGAFGFLCRQLGLAADYLYAVEVVTVDADGQPHAVVGTREDSDPNRDLWWGHTGGGGGNFGIATRYWFRATDASGDDPRAILPAAPSSITTFKVEWNWSDLDDRSFLRLLTNHGEWCEQNSGVDTEHASLWTLLEIHRKQLGKIVVRGVSTAGDGAERQMRQHVDALADGGVAPSAPEIERLSWLGFALNPLPELFAMPPGGVSVKVKDAMLKKRFTDRQIGIAYDYLTRTDYDVMGGVLGMATYGGRVNAIAPSDRAAPQRSSILDTACNTGWIDAADAEKNLRWVRNLYRDLFIESGGAPIPDAQYDGALINHPDTDLADPEFNTSGVPWSTIYYQGNYAKLQEIKRRWDPRDVFRHALSIRPR